MNQHYQNPKHENDNPYSPTKKIKTQEDCAGACNISQLKFVDNSISSNFYKIEVDLCNDLIELNYGMKVKFIYNPIEYAKEIHVNFLDTYCSNVKSILFIGLNPGPWGMCQTGV